MDILELFDDLFGSIDEELLETHQEPIQQLRANIETVTADVVSLTETNTNLTNELEDSNGKYEALKRKHYKAFIDTPPKPKKEEEETKSLTDILDEFQG